MCMDRWGEAEQPASPVWPTELHDGRQGVGNSWVALHHQQPSSQPAMPSCSTHSELTVGHVQENLMQILHHNSQGYASGQALKKPQKQRGPAGFAPPPSPMDVLLPNLSVYFVQATGAADAVRAPSVLPACWVLWEADG